MDLMGVLIYQLEPPEQEAIIVLFVPVGTEEPVRRFLTTARFAREVDKLAPAKAVFGYLIRPAPSEVLAIYNEAVAAARKHNPQLGSQLNVPGAFDVMQMLPSGSGEVLVMSWPSRAAFEAEPVLPFRELIKPLLSEYEIAPGCIRH